MLELLYRYDIFLFLDPYILPWQQVDKGAIRFVLSGANIMCPGLTSPGARMTPCPKGAIVVNFDNCQYVHILLDAVTFLDANLNITCIHFLLLPLLSVLVYFFIRQSWLKENNML